MDSPLAGDGFEPSPRRPEVMGPENLQCAGVD